MFLVGHVFYHEGEYTGEVTQKFVEMIPEFHVQHHNTIQHLINKCRELVQSQTHQGLARQNF